MIKIINHAVLVMLVVLACTSCGVGMNHKLLLLAEEQLMQKTDSCEVLLNQVSFDDLNDEDKALHGLISSWLLYRQYAKDIPEEPLQTAFNYFHDSQDPLRKAQVYFLRSVIHKDQNRGLPSEWTEDLYSACLAIEKTDDYLLASQIYQNYSTTFTHVKQYDEAKVWVDKFVNAARKSGNKGEYVQALIYKSENSLHCEEARVQREIGSTDGNLIARHTRFTDAFTAIYTALDIAKKNEMKVALGRIYTQLSIYHSFCQQLDSLLYYAKLSVKTNEELYAKGLRKEATNYVTLSDAYRKLGQADSAIYYAQKTLSTPGTPLRNKKVAAQMMYLVYSELKNDYKTSLMWMRRFNELEEMINKESIASNVDAAQNAAKREQEKSILRQENKHTTDWLVWSIVIGALIIAGITVRLVLNRRKYLKQLKLQEAEFNHMIDEMRSKNDEIGSVPVVSDAASADDVPDEVVLTGNTKEQLKVNVSSILYLTSDSNYIKVYHLDDEGKVQSKMIRQTMTAIESQLKSFPHIVRCHRAFIVNLQHVKSALSTTSGLLLTFDVDVEHVPVSKTYISLIKNSLK